LLAIALAGLGLPAASPSGRAAAADLYVARDTGNDQNPGTAEKPLATLAAAQQAVAELRKQPEIKDEPITVWLRGSFRLDASWTLTSDNSGLPGKPTTFCSWGEQAARLVGGRPIPPKAFSEVTEPAVRRRLSEKARDHVLAAELAPLGFAKVADPADAYRSGGMPELFVDGVPMQIARWPNEGWLTIKEVIDRGADESGEITRPGTFVYEGDRPTRWNLDQGVWLYGYWCHDWSSEFLRIGSIDAEHRRITLAAPHGYGIGASHSWNKHPRRYYALNLLEELDAPGEWYLDRDRSILYFWPPEPLADARVMLSELGQPMIEIRDAAHVHLKELILEVSRGDGIHVRGGEANRLVGCTLRNLGGSGVALRGGSDHGVLGCDLYRLGKSGVSVYGGDRKSLTPGKHLVQNNHIHHFGRLQRTYAAAIHLHGVGNRAANNLIHDAPHAAILYGGNEHVIELNDVHHVALETSDVGVFYTGRDWTSRGNVIRWNYLHETPTFGACGTMGVYLDDCDSGDTLYGNVFYKTGRAAFIGGGRDNTVENNLMIDCNAAVHLDARGVARMRFDLSPHDSWNLPAKAERLNYRQPPWSERYPKLARVMEEEPVLPLGNVVRRNVAVNCQRWLSLSGNMKRPITELAERYPEMRKYLDVSDGAKACFDRVVFEDNLVLEDGEDPGFVDPAAGNFQLRDDSIVFEKVPGFEKIPFERIGLQRE
jgi:hypothetical protein